MVTPVFVSPLIIAQLIGAAPRYCGNSEACKLNVPYSGILQTTLGNILKATTICKLAFSDFRVFKKSSSFRLVGCSTLRLFSTAYFLTAD